MPKKVISIKNFKLGLDRRRAEISSVPGALFIAKDGHINTGGEFEKRKAFIQYANLAILDTNGSQGTFGLKSTIDGLYTFGSAYLFSDKQTTHRATAANVATLTLGANHSFVVGDLIDVVGITGYTASNVAVTAASSTTISYANVHANEATTVDVTGTVRIHQTLSQPRLVSAIPAGISYQRLLHPAISDGVTYDATKYRMTGIVHATTFNNLLWVIAAFADGYQFPYYDAALVQDFVAGYILPYQAGNDVLIAKHLTRMTNLTTEDYTAVQQPIPNDDRFVITGPYGNDYGIAKDVNTVGNGDLTLPTQLGAAVSPVVAQSAIGRFKIMGGTTSAGVNKITNVKVGPVGSLDEILHTAVDWTIDNATTAAAVAVQINAYTSTPNYTATANNNEVVIKAVTTGVATNGYVVETTVGGNVCVGDWRFSLTSQSGSPPPVPISVDSVTVDGNDILDSITQGVVPYTTSFSNTASLVATRINTTFGVTGGTVNHGYVAVAFGASIRVSKKVTSSADAPIAAFVNTNNIGVGTGSDPGEASDIVVTASPTQLQIISLSPSFRTDSTYVTVVGGTAPYTYNWYQDSTLLLSTSSNEYHASGIYFGSYYDSRYCIVTDVNGLTGQSNMVLVRHLSFS